MKIQRACFAPGKSSFFFDDQAAIKGGARGEGFAYAGDAVTPGFRRIRVAGESVSVLLVLEDGAVAAGDCTAVQYSGSGGRDPLFLAESYLPFLTETVAPLLVGRTLERFRPLAEELDGLKDEDGRPLHTALRYGLTQAALNAVALARRKMACQVLCEEYDLPFVRQPIPIFGQSGDDRYLNAEKMILKGVPVLPHGLINNVDDKLGCKGEKLADYVTWLAKRIATLAPGPDYHPTIHIDVYGTLGLIFGNNPGRIADYLAQLEERAAPFDLYIEGPVDAGSRSSQIEALAAITRTLETRGCGVKIVADEWCNTLEDIRLFCDARACHMVQIKTPDLGGIGNIVESIRICHDTGVEPYQGGSCNETDVSARTCVHVAMAARPNRMLAKPGMGFDEGYSIVNNEMERIIALAGAEQ